MQAINLRSFKIKARRKKKGLRTFLTKLENNPPKNLDSLAEKVDKEVWKEVDCLTCANCCKTMTPTFKLADIKRISAHFDMSPEQFKKKWLRYEKKDKDWVNIATPCQFLDLKTNMCSIYDIRPLDCSGFPHLAKRKMTDYMHVHKQNIEYCPATFIMVEKMQLLLKAK